MPPSEKIFRTICLCHIREAEGATCGARRATGRPRVLEFEYLLDRIVYALRTGCQWSALPVRDGSYKTVHHYFHKWALRGVFERAWHDTVRWYKRVRPARRGRPRAEARVVVIDTSFVKNVHGRDVLGRNPTDRGRNATKVSMLTDARGTPLALTFHRANRHDSKTLAHTLRVAERSVGVCGWADTLHADKGYDAQTCREACLAYGLRPVISRRGRPTDRRDNATRVVVEQTFGLLDQFRRIRVRYDAKIQTFKAFHFVACGLIAARRVSA